LSGGWPKRHNHGKLLPTKANIGIFDRTNLPDGMKLEQADATSWMAMYAGNMLTIALEISLHDPTFEDVATKFYEHYIYISEAFNRFGLNEKGLWNEEDGFYYDIATLPNGEKDQIRVRSIVGLSCLFSASIISDKSLKSLPSFHTRLDWFRNYRLSRGNFFAIENFEPDKDMLLSIIPKEKLKRILQVMLDESEFLSDYGIRSVSKYYEQNYYKLKIDNIEYGIGYEPAESTSPLFGGNSNWRGPIWIPMNYLLLEALDTYYHYYGDSFTVEFPSHSGEFLNLNQIRMRITQRLLNKYLPDKDGRRPIHGEEQHYSNDPHFKNLLLFYEYFDGDNGRGCGASHQTGWGSLISEYISLL
jgi:hypothetical protein